MNQPVEPTYLLSALTNIIAECLHLTTRFSACVTSGVSYHGSFVQVYLLRRKNGIINVYSAVSISYTRTGKKFDLRFIKIVLDAISVLLSGKLLYFVSKTDITDRYILHTRYCPCWYIAVMFWCISQPCSTVYLPDLVVKYWLYVDLITYVKIKLLSHTKHYDIHICYSIYKW